MEKKDTARAAAPVIVDWSKVTRDALGSAFMAGIVAGGLKIISDLLAAEAERLRNGASAPVTPSSMADRPADESDEDEDDDEEDEVEVNEAAALLGIDADASESEIRAALRARLASSRLHPDHGGDGEEAKRLIAAQNLLIARLRDRDD